MSLSVTPCQDRLSCDGDHEAGFGSALPLTEISLLMIRSMILLALLPLMAGACAQQPVAPASSPQGDETAIARHLDAPTFATLMTEKPDHLLIDVRSPGETAQGILPRAQEINFYEADFGSRISALPKDKPVFVYCRSGNRSGKAMAQMKDMGFQEVYNLQGGIGAWQAAGLPVVQH